MTFGLETEIVHGSQTESKECRTIVLNSLNDEEHASENITQKRLEDRIATLEHAKYAFCFPSGTAACCCIAQLLENGDHAIIFDSVYHGTRTYLKIRDSLRQIDVTFADLRDPRNLEKNLTKKTKMVWVETPCNPTMKIVDIAAISDIVKKKTKAILVVDNTFMSSYFQNPLDLGADVVMHSLTKYMNGYSDVLMGAAATNSDELYQKMKSIVNLIGSFPSPTDCFLALRGLRTLHLRMEKHAQNALEVATFLEGHPKVDVVFYPGLKSHPQHEIAKKQSRGFGGMVSFRTVGGTAEVRRFAARIKVFTLAVSLGSIESLMDISSLMTAAGLSKEERLEIGVTDSLVRLSIGLESAKDLINDLDQALQDV